jgi:hypothetical protein
VFVLHSSEWDGLDMSEALPRAVAHRRLPDAITTLAAGMLALSESDPAIDSIFKDAGRYMATLWASLLDETVGLTLPALKAVCARSRLLSAGRARAVLIHLQRLGFAVRRPTGGRAVGYQLTPAFHAAWDAQLRAALEAGRRMEPRIGCLLAGADPAPLRAFGRIHAEGLRALTLDGTHQTLPIVRVFLHAHAGSQILWSLIGLSEDGAAPPCRAGPVTLAGLARRFGVSRVHLKRIFAQAEREGLARLDRAGLVTFTPAAREQLGYLFGAQLAQILVAAAAAAKPSEPVCDQECPIVTVPGEA